MVDEEDGEEFVLDPDSQAADEREIEEIIAEVEREHALTSTEQQFGSTTVAKVSYVVTTSCRVG